MAGAITLLIVLGLALYICWLMLQPFFNVLLWAMVLAVVFYPMHRRIRDRSEAPVAGGGHLDAAGRPPDPPAGHVHHHRRRARAVGRRGQPAGGRPAADRSQRPRASAGCCEKARNYVDIDQESARQFLAERMQTWGAALARSTLVVVGGAVGAVAQMVLVVFTMFYLFRDGERLAHRGRRDAAARARPDARRSRCGPGTSSPRRIYGVLVIAAIQGTLGTFIFWVLGLPSPLLWGVVMFFLSMIPMAGSFLVWVPAAVFLARDRRAA